MDHGYRIWAGSTTTGEIDWILSLRFLECYYCMIARLKKKVCLTVKEYSYQT